MRIQFRHLSGRVEVREFSDWRKLCDWLKFNYVLRDLVNHARKIKEGYLREISK